MEKKRKFPFFLIFVLLLIAVLTAATLYGWKYADAMLEEYQASLPQNVIDEYYARLAAGDYSIAMELADYTPNGFNTEAKFREWLDEKYGSYTDLIYIRAVGATNKKTEYRVYSADKTRVGTVFVRPTGDKTEHGFTLWQVFAADKPQYLTDYTVTLPGDATLSVNGLEVSESVLFSEQPCEDFPDFGEFAAPKVKTYFFARIISNSEFTAISPDGSPCMLCDAPGSNIIFCHASLRNVELEILSKKALPLYVSAVNSAEGLDEFLEYLVKDTSFFKTMKDYHRWWIIYQPEYKSAQILDLDFPDIRYCSSERVILSVSFNYKVVSTVRTETFPASYKIFFVKAGDEWKIADMTVS